MEARNIKELAKAGPEASLFRTLIEYMRDPFYILDPKDGFRMVYANQAACLHFELDREQLLGMRVPDWDPEFDMGIIDVIMEELKQGKQMHFETLHRVASGELIPVEVTFNYLIHDGEELTAGFFYDISERKAMEMALKESEKNLIEAQRIARVGNWARDLCGKFLSVSAECSRIFGMVETEFAGTFEALLKHMHPEDRGKVQSSIETLLKTRLPYSVEYRLMLVDGTERIVHEKGEAVCDATGIPVRLIGTVQEITERKRVEDALRKSEERYALAIDGVNDGIWERDLITGEVYFSRRWKSILGFEDHEISNSIFEWKKRIHPDDYQKVINTNKAYLNGHIPTYEIEYRLQHKDGSYRWIYARGACLRDPYGMPYRIAGSHTDITSRKIPDSFRSIKRYNFCFGQCETVS